MNLERDMKMIKAYIMGGASGGGGGGGGGESGASGGGANRHAGSVEDPVMDAFEHWLLSNGATFPKLDMQTYGDEVRRRGARAGGRATHAPRIEGEEGVRGREREKERTRKGGERVPGENDDER